MRLFIRDLRTDCRVGVYEHERGGPQTVRLDITLDIDDLASPLADDLGAVVDYDGLVQRVRAELAGEHTELIETLAERVAALCLEDARVRAATVRIDKPGVLPDVGAVGIEIERRRTLS